jgi:hypothetical protein
MMADGWHSGTFFDIYPPFEHGARQQYLSVHIWVRYVVEAYLMQRVIPAKGIFFVTDFTLPRG